MTVNEYQIQASQTAKEGADRMYFMLGLTEEVGELAQRFKRMMSAGRLQPSQADYGQLTLDLGDVLWYVSALARELGINLEVVALANLRKLGIRGD